MDPEYARRLPRPRRAGGGAPAAAAGRDLVAAIGPTLGSSPPARCARRMVSPTRRSAASPKATPPAGRQLAAQASALPGAASPLSSSSASSSSGGRRCQISDRFIPSRAALSVPQWTASELKDDRVPQRGVENASERADEASKVTYNLLLKNELLGARIDVLKGHFFDDKLRAARPVLHTAENGNVFKFQSPGAPRKEPASPFSLSAVGMDSHRLLTSPRKQTTRRIPKVPFKVLDAPELVNDFYLNLVDWSSQNVLSVGLGKSVYLWSACTSQVTKLCDLKPGDAVTSVSWMQRGSHLAIGTHLGQVQIWDAQRLARVRTMTGHSSRVGSLAWNTNMLSTGSRDRSILQRDVRVSDHFVDKLQGHRQEVCGLQWSPDDRYLASGGNDNRLLVWSPSRRSPVHSFNKHLAAVKAIAWSPHQHGLLASGGGTADQCIRFWNTLTSQPLRCVDTHSQVCNLAWSKTSNELVSTHGYSQNAIRVWKYPSMSTIATLTGHTYRVLYLAMSPDGQTIVTGAGDETLRFWNVFSKNRSPKGSKSVLSLFSQVR